eukprot:4632828-Amphidinium_carterae.1
MPSSTNSFQGGCSRSSLHCPGFARSSSGASLFREAAGVQRVRPSVKTPSTPKHYVHIQYFLDKECTQPEGECTYVRRDVHHRESLLLVEVLLKSTLQRTTSVFWAGISLVAAVTMPKSSLHLGTLPAARAET